MSDQRRVISADQYHPDPYTQSRTAERTLNSAIVHAEISRSHEEYLDIFDEFYADDIEGSSETTREPIRGKARVRSLLFSFLVPLHAMAEIGSVSISVRETAIPGDVVDETHSAWTLELVGVSGKIRNYPLAHLPEMERIAGSAGASLRPPGERSAIDPR